MWLNKICIVNVSINGPISKQEALATKQIQRNAKFWEPLFYVPKIVYMDLDYINRITGRLNKKDGLTRYGNSHVKDKTS